MSDSTTVPTTDLGYLVPPWLRDTPLYDIWLNAYADTGDPAAAIEAVRGSSVYDTYFAGNRREDGSLRWTEGEYQANMESYEDSLVAVGLDRAFVQTYFQGQFIQLIEGNVDGDEFWTTRVKPIYDRVIRSSEAIQKEYADAFGITDLTPEAIFASILDPETVGTGILDKTIAISEIRGAYNERFNNIGDITTAYFESLLSRGDVGLDQARTLFAAADTMLPVLTVLANRHTDPNDEFNLEDFTQASIWNDPEQASRMRRLMQQERASFAQASSQTDWLRNRLTAATGLEER